MLAKPVPPTCQDPVRKPVRTFEIGQWVIRRGRDIHDVKVGGRYRVLGYNGAALLLANLLGDCLYGSYDPQYFDLDSSYVQPLDQHDPNGIDQHAPGAKLDAGKLRPALVLGGFASAVQAMVKVGSDGARKYTDNGWKTVPDGKARYEDALLRHLLAHLSGEELDPESGSPHISHCMWNAAAIYELNKGNQNV